MKIAEGKVVGGKIEVEGHPFAEGAKVTIVAPEADETFELNAEDEAELLEAIAEADRGEVVPIEEVFRKIGRPK